jgi:hypothetical protein
MQATIQANFYAQLLAHSSDDTSFLVITAVVAGGGVGLHSSHTHTLTPAPTTAAKQAHTRKYQ